MDEPNKPANETPSPGPAAEHQSNVPRPETPVAGNQPKSEVIKEIHHHHYESKHGIGLGRLLVGLVLVMVGLAYLGNSTGWFHINIDLWRLWPLLIVILGLSMLSRRGWVAWLIGAIVTLVVLGAVALALFSNTSFGNRDIVQKGIAIDKITGAEKATVSIDTGAGQLIITGGADRVVNGTFESNFADLATESTLSGTEQRVEISAKGKWSGFGNHRNDLDLKLMSDLPTELSIDSGASDMNLDLRTIMASRISIDTGASDLELHLGDRATLTNVKVKAGASSVAITVPTAVGVRLKLDAGVSSKDIDSDIKRVDDQNYQTDNYNTADKKIELDLDLGVASFELNQE